MIDQQLLDILACPESHEPVALADESLINTVNRKIESGHLLNRVGEKVTEPIDGGLVRADGRYLYAIREDIPIMLVEQAIPLEGIDDEG
ncbi:MAG: Trm112 family protein [Deltaproteobacteria bacterium]|nr:Trm112 family protein [Deltaproteobacteria bacterium]